MEKTLERDVRTHLKARDYNQHEVCRILNPKQVKLYIKNNAYPIDIYSSYDDKGNDVIVYIFLKEDTKELFKAWSNYELE